MRRLHRTPYVFSALLSTLLLARGAPDTPYRAHTASDVVALLRAPGTFEVVNPRVVTAQEVLGLRGPVPTRIPTTDIIRFDTPSLCEGCGVLVLSFASDDYLAEARSAIEAVNAAGPAPVWRIIEKRNLLILFDPRIPANSTYVAMLCFLDDTCPEGDIIQPDQPRWAMGSKAGCERCTQLSAGTSDPEWSNDEMRSSDGCQRGALTWRGATVTVPEHRRSKVRAI